MGVPLKPSTWLPSAATSAQLLGAFVFVLGAATMTLWLGLDAMSLRQFRAWSGMVFNAGALCALAGGLLALPARAPKFRNLVPLVGALLASVAALLLLQDICDWELGIDRWFVDPTVADARNSHPGRMAPNTAASFALTGLAFVALGLPRSSASAVALPVLTFSILALGALGFAERVFALEFLSIWFDRPAMTLHASAGVLAIGAALWLRWVETPAYAQVFATRADRKLRLLEAGILISCVSAAGLAGLAATLSETERALTRDLSLGLDGGIRRMESLIGSERRILALLAAQEPVRRALDEPDDPGAVPAIASVLGARYRYVELRIPGRPLLVHRGTVRAPALEVDFPGHPGSGLLFTDELGLKISVEIGGRATLIVIVPMPEIEALLRDPHSLGESASLNLCVDNGSAHVRCFPSRHEPHVTLRPKSVRTERVPMARALSGERGVSPAVLDTRGVPVLAAYAPVPELGLGAVLKVGTAELYRPISQKLTRGLPILVALVAIGMLLLGTQVTPLVRSLVTAERQASSMSLALERKERHTRAILDGVSDGIVSLEPDSTLCSLNPASLRLLGGTPEQLLGRRLSDFVAKRETQTEILRLCRGEVSDAVEPGAHVVPLELKRLDGSTLEADIAIDGIDAGEPFSVGVIRDTSRQRFVERMKDEFVTTVSHELRTPLTAIRGALGLVMGGIGGPIHPAGRELLNIAFGNLERLIQLVNDILDFEKIAAGKLPFSFRPTAIEQVVAETMKTMAAYATLHKVELVLTRSERGHVLADADRLQQALTNLLSNAVKHSPAGAVVEIVLSRAEDAFRVAVSDRGKGVPEGFRERIFQPFAQADASASRRTGGTGLGLSITKSIIERHRGRIAYTSRPGEGTTFFFDLPVCRDPLDAAPRASLAPVSPAPRLPRILHVSDELASRGEISVLLGDFAVVTARSASPATLELPEDGRYDVVLLDLPRASGLGSELVHAARCVGNFTLVYMAPDDLLDETVRALVDDVLFKTAGAEGSLRRRIEELLRSSGRFEGAVPVHVS